MKRLFLFLTLLFLSVHSAAHNVVGGVYVSGADIEGEAGFSNGAMAHEGTLVKVFDEAGTPLGEVKTDTEGFFIFTAKKRITHVFEINMGAGHILKMQLPVEELPESLVLGAPVKNTVMSDNNNNNDNNNNKQLGSQQITSFILEKAIAKQIKPLRKEIQALKEKSGLRDMLGGIGYIFGLLGVVAFIRERKLKASK